MIFASLEIERDPLRWAEFPAYLATWIQVAGSVAALALILWFIHYFAEKRQFKKEKLSFWALALVISAGLSFTCYMIFLGFIATQGVFIPTKKGPLQPGAPVPAILYSTEQQLFLTLGGLFALLAVTIPMLGGLMGRISSRRIGAIARLSVKEAIRGRVIYGFGLMILIFLFAPYFLSYRDEDQIRNYVMVIYWAMAPLFLVTAAFLGSFSIPTDVQKQTIHTIVTKPVEKYEIVLGRFFGYGFLLTLVLAVLALVSLFYVWRGVNPRAAEESYKARVPIFADQLRFYGTTKAEVGENVGREWTYRSYIRGRLPGSNEPRQYAVWTFGQLPESLGSSRDPINFEFTFDIFRTTKGKENQGVFCTLTFAAGYLSLPEIERNLKEMKDQLYAGQKALEEKLKGQQGDRETQEKNLKKEVQKLKDELSEKYGVYQEGGTVIEDYNTQAIAVPSGLFHHLIKKQQEISKLAGSGQELPPTMVVLVNVNDDPASAAQFVGVAKRDLYVLPYELPFWQNFLKMILGLWCNTMLILGVAVACSTYLSGIISLLCALFVMGAGTMVDYMRSLASGTNIGGGPFESFNRLLYRLPMSSELETTAATQVGTGLDIVFRWVLGFVLNLIPDVSRFNLTEYVANGFDISWSQIIILDNFLLLLGYLIPWGILAYYLMNNREIANPM